MNPELPLPAGRSASPEGRASRPVFRTSGTPSCRAQNEGGRQRKERVGDDRTSAPQLLYVPSRPSTPEPSSGVDDGEFQARGSRPYNGNDVDVRRAGRPSLRLQSQGPGDDHPLDLARPLDDAEHADPPEDPFDGSLGQQPHASVDLNRSV